VHLVRHQPASGLPRALLRVPWGAVPRHRERAPNGFEFSSCTYIWVARIEFWQEGRASKRPGPLSLSRQRCERFLWRAIRG
jgi:hypothetical protein